ncbi:MAG: FixH family protein [Alphaproteobacteria bacterium]|uniref:FixH family protein n=1 Tax=Rhizobium sp. AAP116 TaxID=1523429 RepID=UPI0006B95439|nr:FixH family protein [Rhizobium sp. AAP116]MBU0739849.1 FixH family protein [Alphaproteobacteria bacterium]MDM7981638.1 FixH family protein [Rhizobium sp.]KPF58047.1 cation transporter [Rhizobium sp. AAP116]MBU0834777.1 FixH family protein [Alphaproteobacteria bacterium]MBU1763608.1 FixH family protein [Alphaproteobacteria bacterium]
MSTYAKKPFTFTGWHMLAIMLAFFGTIITVNFTMAYLATSTWSGLVVKNTYVASQQFNGKTAAIREMLATGIAGELSVDAKGMRYRLTLPENTPVIADSVTAHFKRPVGTAQDFELQLTPAGDGLYLAEMDVLAGSWIVEIQAIKDGKMIMHEAKRITVSGE